MSQSKIIRDAIHNASAATHYWPSTEGHVLTDRSELSIYFAASGGVTVTLEFAAMRDIAEDTYTTDWADVTKDALTLSGAQMSAYVDVTRLLVMALLRGRWRLKYVCSDATNDLVLAVNVQQTETSIGLMKAVDSLSCAEKRAAATTTLASDPHDWTAAPAMAGIIVDTDGVYKLTLVGDADSAFITPYLLKGVHYPYAVSRVWATGSPAGAKVTPVTR